MLYKRIWANSTGEEHFKLIDNFFCDHEPSWKFCKCVCSDGAAAMTETVNGLVARIKKDSLSVQWVHYNIHREVLLHSL